MSDEFRWLRTYDGTVTIGAVYNAPGELSGYKVIGDDIVYEPMSSISRSGAAFRRYFVEDLGPVIPVMRPSAIKRTAYVERFYDKHVLAPDGYRIAAISAGQDNRPGHVEGPRPVVYVLMEPV